MKICRLCKEEKDLELFKKQKLAKDGKSSLCKACHVKQTLEHRKTKHLKNHTDKKCRRCKAIKTIDKFSPYAHNKNLIRNICRECYNLDKRKKVAKDNLIQYYQSSKNNQYALKTCKKHGKLNYNEIGLEIHHEHKPIAVILKCLLCDKENKARKFNDDNLIINTANSIIVCNKCLKKKFIFEYYSSELKRTTPSCRECLKERQIKNKDKYKLKKYGLTVEEYQKMLIVQNGVCKICCQPEAHKYKKDGKVTQLSVDHCHNTGKVRSLLCRNCNIIIGNAKDSIETLRSAALYLEEYK